MSGMLCMRYPGTCSVGLSKPV